MDYRVSLLGFLLCLAPNGHGRRSNSGGMNEKHLLHYLFKDKYYNRMERPVENESLPLHVDFSMVLQQIIDVDEKHQIMQTNLWLQMTWKAYNLVWDPYEFGGIETIRVPAEQVWRPDILLYNSADEKFDATFHTNVVIKYDGTCLWVPPGMFKSTCSIDITWFPFDEQKCRMRFGSWTHDGRFLDLRMANETGDTSTFVRNGEWDLVEVPGQRNVEAYECCPAFYIDIVYTIHIRRRTLYYGFNLIIPCLLISSMSLLLFLLPPDAGEKISLGVTILLSLMVFLLLVAETMPPTSDALPLIGIYFCCIMVMCSLSVLFTVIVLNFHHRGPESHILPAWVKFGLNGWIAKRLHMRRPGLERRNSARILHRNRLGDMQLQERQGQNLLTGVTEAGEECCVCAENGRYCSNIQVDSWAGNPKRAPKRGDSVPTHADSHASATTEHYRNNEVGSILREIKKITFKLKRDEEETEIKNEWKFAALVIDRICLWICLFATIVSTLAILVSAPHLIA